MSINLDLRHLSSQDKEKNSADKSFYCKFIAAPWYHAFAFLNVSALQEVSTISAKLK